MDFFVVALIVLAAFVVVGTLFVLALVFAAQGADEQDHESGVLATLATVRSPSGRPFFANSESVQDFVKTLDDSRDVTLRVSGRRRPRRPADATPRRAR